MRCFAGCRQCTDPRLLQQAHQKSGSFPPPALPGFGDSMTLSDSHLCHRLSAPLRPLPSPTVGLPRYPHHPSGVPCPLPRRIKTGALVDGFPARAAFPVMQAGRHPHLSFRGLLRLHSRYGPSDCSTPSSAIPRARARGTLGSVAQGGLCHAASIQPVARPNRSSATRAIDNSLGGTSLVSRRWCLRLAVAGTAAVSLYFPWAHEPVVEMGPRRSDPFFG
jgi:hypothetical protein